MERLAGVSTQPAADLAILAPALRRRGGGGLLVMVTGRADHDLLIGRPELEHIHRRAARHPG